MPFRATFTLQGIMVATRWAVLPPNDCCIAGRHRRDPSQRLQLDALQMSRFEGSKPPLTLPDVAVQVAGRRSLNPTLLGYVFEL